MSEATLPLSTKRLLLALAVLGGLWLFDAPTASAAPNPSDEGCNQDDVCRDHFVKGKSLYKEQDYTNALTEFQSAYERRQTPILLANIGRTLQKLGRPKEALEYYLRCQDAAQSDTELQAKLKGYIVETKALLVATSPQRPAEVTEPPPSPPAVALTSPPPADKPKPVYKKAWFWAVIGVGAAVVVGGVVTGVVLANQPHADPPLDPAVTVLRPMF